MKLSFIILQAIRLLVIFEFYTSQFNRRYSGWKQHGDQEMNVDGEMYQLYQEFLRGGEILTTFLIYKMVLLQGRT